MDFSQVIGFLVTMAAMIYIFVKRAKDRHQGSHNHEEHEQAEKLEDFLKSLEEDMDESKHFRETEKAEVKNVTSPVAPRAISTHTAEPPRGEFKFRSDLDNFKTKTNIDDRKLKIDIKNKYAENYGEHLLSSQFRRENKIPEVIGFKKASRIKGLILSLPSKKDMVLLHEVLDKPKGFNVFR